MGTEIRDARLEQNLSQKDLAKRSGVSRSIISGLENGKITVVKTSTIKRIADALNKKVSDIFFKENV